MENTKEYLRIEDTSQLLREFTDFCRVDLALSKRTVETHIKIVRVFLRKMRQVSETISKEDVRDYLSWLKENRTPKTYSNYLGTLKRFFRDFLNKPQIVNSFRFPNIVEKAKVIPSKEQLQTFFNALPLYGRFQNVELEPRYHAFFLLVATSGLRFIEAQSLKKKDIFSEKRTVIPKCHETNSTKNSWVTFYNEECEKHLSWTKNLCDEERIFPCTRSIREAFRKTCKTTGIQISPQVLREWFCQEMGNLGVPDRFVDAFCGRVPKSVLARRYTDYSPEKLKEIYDKASLKVLS